MGNCLPNAAMLDPTLLRTLPLYQRKATLLDALCHGIESCWSMHTTPESRAYSVRAIRQVLEHAEGYLTNQDAGNAGMLQAANLAGKAIHIAKTTAAHAMCYRLTTLFGIAHGHAAALCLSALFPELLCRNRHPPPCGKLPPPWTVRMEQRLHRNLHPFCRRCTCPGFPVRFRLPRKSLQRP